MQAKIESPKDIATAGVIASSLEVCGWPKPGNVHRMADAPDATFEQFICGSISLWRPLHVAAAKGLKAARAKIELNQIGVGRLVKYAVNESRRWQRGGNTNLGTAMLLLPLASAAGMNLSTEGVIYPDSIRKSLVKIIEAATPIDSANVYDAIRKMEPTWLESLPRREGPPDIMDPDYRRKLKEGGFTLLKVMEYSSPWDNVARELATGLAISFEEGYPKFVETFEETGDINSATVNTFLHILSKHPDTFILRKLLARGVPQKAASETAQKVSRRAASILSLGGVATQAGRRSLEKFDRDLRKPGEELNPGTTADITACVLMIALLAGLRV